MNKKNYFQYWKQVAYNGIQEQQKDFELTLSATLYFYEHPDDVTS